MALFMIILFFCVYGGISLTFLYLGIIIIRQRDLYWQAILMFIVAMIFAEMLGFVGGHMYFYYNATITQVVIMNTEQLLTITIA